MAVECPTRADSALVTQFGELDLASVDEPRHRPAATIGDTPVVDINLAAVKFSWILSAVVAWIGIGAVTSQEDIAGRPSRSCRLLHRWKGRPAIRAVDRRPAGMPYDGKPNLDASASAGALPHITSGSRLLAKWWRLPTACAVSGDIR